MLTDGVQIDYAQTEGYVPVTSKAQQTERYQDYLSREGEDNQMYYEVKLQASKLLLDNVENTFVTPVFNGSASLRDAAGQLIENTVKSVRRGETVDEAYFEKLYANVTSLYRLDQGGGVSAVGKQELGELPAASAVLLISLAVIWVCIGLYVLRQYQKRKKSQKND